MVDDHEHRLPEHDAYPPPPNEQPREDRATSRRLLGCGASLVAGIVAVIVLLSMVPSCEFDLTGGSWGGDPGTGTHSEKLGVFMAPTTGLHDGSVVKISSPGFEARSVVGVAVCLQEADTQRKGVDACDEVQGARYAVGTDGTLSATYPVPREIRVDGDIYDCGARPARCLLVAADARDYDRSGGQALTFDAAAPPPTTDPPTVRPQTDHLKVGAQPEGPITGNTLLTVVATGFQPGEPLLAAWCRKDFEDDGPSACEATDFDAAIAAVMGTSDLSFDLVATDAGGATVTLPARRTIAPFGAGDDRYDCRTAPGRCAIVIAAGADPKRSAVYPYTLQPG